MRIHVISCRVFTRELCRYIADSDSIVDVSFLPQGLHDTPVILNRMLGEAVENVEIQLAKKQLKYRPDYIALAYGLCSNGVLGLTAGEIPLVIPRTDDCIALFLGSQKRYLEAFHDHAGTYWFNNGWIETAFVPSPEGMEAQREQYARDYGEDNCDYLMQELCRWVENYKNAGYITSPVRDLESYRDVARRAAAANGWEYKEFEGDGGMLRRLLSGDYDDREFLVVPPGYTVEPTYDELKIKAVPHSL